jgi:hypothetical protein
MPGRKKKRKAQRIRGDKAAMAIALVNATTKALFVPLSVSGLGGLRDSFVLCVRPACRYAQAAQLRFICFGVGVRMRHSRAYRGASTLVRGKKMYASGRSMKEQIE